ncbi:hypothetical protein HY994_06950 [Candidatus Micrarchaeota archaeon]|nr:hypothetical protein [Candidatus Micrarchaeota archaeon]
MVFIIGIAFLVALTVTFFALPLFIQSAMRKGIVGNDVNKTNRPKVANLGGIILYFGFAFAILASILALTFGNKEFPLFTALLAGLCSISIVAIIGLYDDTFRISTGLKIILPALGALPLIAITAGDTALSLPLIGAMDFGVFYTFLLIPLGLTGAANAVNMIAGYNGLEAGIGAICSAVLLVIAYSAGATASAVILAAMLGACLAFLKYNWYPAKVFPADIGTLIIGATIAVAVILGNMEKYGIILLLPAFYELLATLYYGLKKVRRRAACHNPGIHADGSIRPPPGAEKYTLGYYILSKKPMREPALVATVLSLFTISGALALAVYWLKI